MTLVNRCNPLDLGYFIRTDCSGSCLAVWEAPKGKAYVSSQLQPYVDCCCLPFTESLACHMAKQL